MYDTPLLFYETILINEAQVPIQARYVKCMLAKWWRERTLLYYYFW